MRRQQLATGVADEQGAERSAGRGPGTSPGPGRDARSLAEVPPGSRALVVAVSGPASPTTTRRLEDLGFAPGSVVEVVRRAPLRDPVVYRVRGSEICLRRTQARLIRTVVAS